MTDNNFLMAKRMAQELVRGRVTPEDLNGLLDYLREHEQEGGASFLAYVQAQADDTIAEPLRQACESYFQSLQGETEALMDMLGWGVGFMRYYRGEGNRPLPGSHPSQPRQQPSQPAQPAQSAPTSQPAQSAQARRRPARRQNEAQEVKFPIDSLHEGQELEGVVRRIMPYGVFISVGSERDGLVHVSEMSSGFTDDPAQVVKIDETIKVWVKNIDLEQKKISLTMKGAEAAMAEEAPRQQQSQQQQPQQSQQQRFVRSESSNEPRQQRGGPSRRRGVSSLRGSSGAAKLYEDDSPKEMTAMAEALRQAMSQQEPEDESPEESPRQKKDGRSEELAEVYRRTLYGQ